MAEADDHVLYKEESYRIIGACMEVYNEKGSGFHEPIYHECLGLEFAMSQIPAVSKPKIEVGYKGRLLEQRFEPDYLCFRKVVVELKAVEKLSNDHRRQVLSYLKATQLRLGLLVNFCNPGKLEYERIIARDAWLKPEPPDLRA